MDLRIAMVTALSRSVLAIIDALVQRRWASKHEPSNVYVVNVLTECRRYRLQVGRHVAWRLRGRRGAAPVVGDLTFGEAVAHVIAVHSPADLAQAASQLLAQTQLLGKEFVRQDMADPWMPDPTDWEEALADWDVRADAYRELEDAYRDLEADEEKIYEAQRAGVFTRLVSEERLSASDAEEWIAAWERQVAEAELEFDGGAFWDEAWEWIQRERSSS
jgi:hypothetical protein